MSATPVHPSTTRPEVNGPADTRELARWLRREYGKVTDMTRLLLEKTAVPPPADVTGWLAALRTEFERYRAHFIQQMALEERGGYLRPVTESHPSLGQQVEQLHAEHEQIIRIMTRIFENLQELSEQDRLRISDCCCRIQNLLRLVRDHECQENRVLSDVFIQDLGTLGH